MHLPSILLRLLMCVTLILNGSAAAMASVGMPLEHAHAMAMNPGSMSSVAESGHEASPPCHESMAVDTAGHPSPAPAPEQTPDPGSPDCCTSGSCMCACAQHGFATSVAAFRVEVVSARSGPVHPLSTGHAEPAQPHLIRPPII
jgi:hypothetical protein